MVGLVAAERAALGVAELAIERDRFRLPDAGLELHQRDAALRRFVPPQSGDCDTSYRRLRVQPI